MVPYIYGDAMLPASDHSLSGFGQFNTLILDTRIGGLSMRVFGSTIKAYTRKINQQDKNTTVLNVFAS